MTVPISSYNFLDCTLCNYDSFSDETLNYLPRYLWQDEFSQVQRYSSIQPPITTKFRGASIHSWRRAEHTDVPEIKKLCTAETESIYGTFSVANLVETSLLPLVLLNELNEVVAFLAIQDYPHVPYIPTTDWEQWLDEMYQVRMYNSLNTRFVHLMVWDDHYERMFIRKILAEVFAEDPYVEYVLLIMPRGMKLKHPYKDCFYHYLAITDLANEKRSVRIIREFKEKYLLGLFVALRVYVGPDIYVRPAKESDDELVTKSIFDQLPGMEVILGESFYADILNERKDDPKRRKILIGEYKNDNKEPGIMTYREEVDLNLVTNYYNTFLYHGFGYLKDAKQWNAAFSEWNKVDPQHSLDRFDR